MKKGSGSQLQTGSTENGGTISAVLLQVLLMQHQHGPVPFPVRQAREHSDADVLTHAVIDALLGAAGLGDIGEHFPDTDERYRDADSLELLQAVVAMIAAEGLALVNVDCTVIMEAPKLAPHRDAIRERLAEALGVQPQRVNVKASTGERMGFVGRGEGVAALAIAGLDRR